jgi:hypothetical protein
MIAIVVRAEQPLKHICFIDLREFTILKETREEQFPKLCEGSSSIGSDIIIVERVEQSLKQEC